MTRILICLSFQHLKGEHEVRNKKFLKINSNETTYCPQYNIMIAISLLDIGDAIGNIALNILCKPK